MVEENYDASINQTYVLLIIPEGVDPNSMSPNNPDCIMGGAVCIHPDGLLISCSRNFSPNCHVVARRHSDTAFRPLQSLQVYPKFDLALGWLSKTTPNETFPHVPLTDSISVVPGEEIFSLIHARRFHSSCTSGHTSYDLPIDVPVPKFSDTVGPTTLAELDRKEKKRYELAEYRAVGMFVEEEDDDEDEEKEGVEDLMGMHPDMPLVQANGMAMSALHSAGCPVFKEKGRVFVGLLCFSRSYFQWIIPVQVISRFVEHLLGPIADIVRPAALTTTLPVLLYNIGFEQL